jgi:hypothetical protein
MPHGLLWRPSPETPQRKARLPDPALFLQLVVDFLDDDDKASFEVRFDLHKFFFSDTKLMTEV